MNSVLRNHRGSVAAEAQRHQPDRDGEAAHSQPVAPGRVEAGAVVEWHRDVQDALGQTRQRVPDLAVAVDQGRDSRVHCPGQRDPVLDCAEDADGQVHVQLGRAVEPAVIREVDQHVRLAACAGLAEEPADHVRAEVTLYINLVTRAVYDEMPASKPTATCRAEVTLYINLVILIVYDDGHHPQSRVRTCIPDLPRQ